MSDNVQYYLGCISRLEAQRDTLKAERAELISALEAYEYWFNLPFCPASGKSDARELRLAHEKARETFRAINHQTAI